MTFFGLDPLPAVNVTALQAIVSVLPARAANLQAVVSVLPEVNVAALPAVVSVLPARATNLLAFADGISNTIPPANHEHETTKIIVAADSVERNTADMAVVSVIYHQGVL